MKHTVQILCFLLVLFTLAGCGSSDAPVRSPEELLDPVAVQVDTVTVTRGDLAVYQHSDTTGFVYEAPVIPYTQMLAFEIGGYVNDIDLIQGDRVTKGQVLATLDDSRTQEEISALQAQIDQCSTLGAYDDRIRQADIAIAKEELAMLRESGALEETCQVKEADIRLLENGLAQAKELRAMEIRELERQIANLRSSLGTLELTAPFDGAVFHVNYDIQFGIRETVGSGEALFYLVDDTRLRIETEYISEAVLTGAERIYALVNGREYDLVYAPYAPEEKLEKLRQDALNTRFTFAEPPQDLKMGDMAAVMVLTDSRENVLTLPVNALHRDGTNYYVKKLENGQQVSCDVTVGLITETAVEICSGLQEGDVVYVKE